MDVTSGVNLTTMVKTLAKVSGSFPIMYGKVVFF